MFRRRKRNEINSLINLFCPLTKIYLKINVRFYWDKQKIKIAYLFKRKLYFDFLLLLIKPQTTLLERNKHIPRK